MMRNGDIPLLHLKGAYRVEVHLQMGMERNSLSCLASREISFMCVKHGSALNVGIVKGDESGSCPKEPQKSVLDRVCGCYMYRATDEISGDAKWHPSIHMPKEAARIWLKVTDVRVERLQKITEDGCIAEGIYPSNCRGCNATFGCDACPDEGYNEVDGFADLWNSTIKKSDLDRYSWDANPWAWVIGFERCEKP